MKTTLSLIALVSLATPAVAAVAAIAGATVPAVFSLEIGLSFFVGSFALLLFGADYGGRRKAYDVKTVGPVLLPADEAFAPGGSRSPFGKRRVTRPSRSYYPTVTL